MKKEKLFVITANELGFSLASMVIALGLISVVVFVASRVISFNMKSENRLRQNYDKNALKMQLLQAVQCPEVLNSSICADFLTLRRISSSGLGPVLISGIGQGSKFGAWTLRAECNATHDGVVIRAAQLSSTGTLTSTQDVDFQPDSLTGKIVKWSDTASLLFPENIEICTLNPSTSFLCSPVVTGPNVFTEWFKCPSGTTTSQLTCTSRRTGWTGATGFSDNDWRITDSHGYLGSVLQVGNQYDEVNDRIRCWCGNSASCEVAACGRCL